MRTRTVPGAAPTIVPISSNASPAPYRSPSAASPESGTAAGLRWTSRTRVPRDLEQPARKGAVPPEALKLPERRREHRAHHVLADGLIANLQPHVAENTVEIAVVQREKRLRLVPRRRHERRIRIDRPRPRPRRLEQDPYLHDLRIFHRPFCVCSPRDGNGRNPLNAGRYLTTTAVNT
jgi:hypothetical protein